MKKVLMMVLLGVFSVLFASEANNVETKGNKYYIMFSDKNRLGSVYCKQYRILLLFLREMQQPKYEENPIFIFVKKWRDDKSTTHFS